jgi:hypothetical protein
LSPETGESVWRSVQEGDEIFSFGAVGAFAEMLDRHERAQFLGGSRCQGDR